uniref:NADH-ubiquinone oxidoreductase chain 4L n=1 Tax=Cionus olens TaxID=201874 RepID=J9PH64_9CUCU|nr:NADH dehydrogenase subunit 4L [Cionus olens]
MMMFYIYSLVFMFMSSFIIFTCKYKHFLVMLLSLELSVLTLYFLLFIFVSNYYYEYFLLMLFLIMSVCEGSLGLSLLIFMIRTHGNDMIMMFDNLW